MHKDFELQNDRRLQSQQYCRMIAQCRLNRWNDLKWKWNNELVDLFTESWPTDPLFFQFMESGQTGLDSFDDVVVALTSFGEPPCRIST